MRGLRWLRPPSAAEAAAALAAISGLAGCGLAVAGVYVLAGLGWALLVGALPPLFFSAILVKGLIRE